MRNRKLLIFCLILLGTSIATAQTATDSPYSRYGYGQLTDPSFGAARSMGGAAIGMRRNNEINPTNPASYSTIDSTTFLMDFAITGQKGIFSEGVNKETKPNGNIDHIAIQFPITKGVGASVGILPYSLVGYQFGNTITNNTLVSTTTYSGEGGFSQAYLGFAVSPMKGLSIGTNLNYLFGTINHTTIVTNTSGAFSIVNINQLHSRGFKTDFGAQWTKSLGKEENICIGLTFTPKTKLSTESLHIKATGSVADTTRSSESYELAATYGLGAGWQINNKWSVAADALFQKWNDALYFDRKDTLNNRFKFAGGVEFTPNLNSRHYYDHIRYRFGGNISNNYLNIKNQKISEYGVSVGLGLPFKSTKSMLNITFDYSKLAPQNTAWVKEEYLRLTLNLTFNEYWFFKRKID
ncbi:MAG: hypothetical protein WCJ03_03540 [Bacteroidales bacterium]